MQPKVALNKHVRFVGINHRWSVITSSHCYITSTDNAIDVIGHQPIDSQNTTPTHSIVQYRPDKSHCVSLIASQAMAKCKALLLHYYTTITPSLLQRPRLVSKPLKALLWMKWKINAFLLSFTKFLISDLQNHCLIRAVGWSHWPSVTGFTIINKCSFHSFI